MIESFEDSLEFEKTIDTGAVIKLGPDDLSQYKGPLFWGSV